MASRHSKGSYNNGDDRNDEVDSSMAYNMPLRLISEVLAPFEETTKSFVRWLHGYVEEGRHHQLGFQSQLYSSLVQQQQKSNFLMMQQEQLLNAEMKRRAERMLRKKLRVIAISARIGEKKQQNNGNGNTNSNRTSENNSKEQENMQINEEGEEDDELKKVREEDEKEEREEKKRSEMLQKEISRRQNELEQQREEDLGVILEHQRADHSRHHSFIHEWVLLCFCGCQLIDAVLMTLGFLVTVVVGLGENSSTRPESGVVSAFSNTDFTSGTATAETIYLRLLLPVCCQILVAAASCFIFWKSRSLVKGLRMWHVLGCCALACTLAVACVFGRSFRSGLLIVFNAAILGFLGTSESSSGGFYIFCFCIIPTILCIITIFVFRFSIASQVGDGHDLYSFLREHLFPRREAVYGSMLLTATLANCVDLAGIALSCYLDVPPLPPGASDLVELVKKCVLRFIRHRGANAMLLAAQHASHSHTSASRRIRDSLGRVAALIAGFAVTTPKDLIEQLSERGQSHLERISTKKTVDEQRLDFETLKRSTWDLEGALVSQLESRLKMLENQKENEKNDIDEEVNLLHTIAAQEQHQRVQNAQRFDSNSLSNLIFPIKNNSNNINNSKFLRRGSNASSTSITSFSQQQQQQQRNNNSSATNQQQIRSINNNVAANNNNQNVTNPRIQITNILKQTITVPPALPSALASGQGDHHQQQFHDDLVTSPMIVYKTNGASAFPS